MKREIIALALIIIVIILTYLVTAPLIKNKKSKYSNDLRKLLNNKIEYEKLLTVSYSNSGNMIGNIYEIDIDLTEKILKLQSSQENGMPIVEVDYKITDENVNDIEAIVRKYNFIGWKDLPFDEENIILDDSVTNLRFKAIDKDNKYQFTSISYDSKIPEDGYPLLKEYTDYIFSLLNDENKINEKNIIEINDISFENIEEIEEDDFNE